MIARAGSGWQTVLADLSLILFLVTVAALSQSPNRDRSLSSPISESEQGQPLAFYVLDDGAPPLAEWLAQQSPDERQQLTIIAQYRMGGQAQALRDAETLVGQSGAAGVAARIVVEPGEKGVVAALAFDIPEMRDALARGLQGSR